MLNLATGHYMNYYNPSDVSFLGSKQMFIIINEPNGGCTEPLDVEKLHKAEEICDKYVDVDQLHTTETDTVKNKNILVKKLERNLKIYLNMESKFILYKRN